MPSPLDRQRGVKKWLHSGLFALTGALVVLALGAATALAAVGEEGEGGPPTVEPVVVPEVEAPSKQPVTVPEATPAPTASAPASTPSAPAPSSAGSSHTTKPQPTQSSGGSKSAPTTVNHSVRGPSSSGSGSTGGGSTGSSQTSSSGSTSSPQTVESGSSSTPATASAPARNLEKIANDLASRAGRAPAKDKQGRQDAVASLGKALGTALLGKAAAVSHPKQDQAPAWVPLPGKSKLPYMLLILAVMALTALVVWTQFRGPRASRRRKARIDHRAGSASGFTLAPGTYPGAVARPRPLRAAADEPDQPKPKRNAPRRGTQKRAPRREAA